jgi:hypothetical protein
MDDFTVSVLQLRFSVRFRGELTGSRWKSCATPRLERPAIRPDYLGPPAARAQGQGGSAVYDALQLR